MTEPEMLDVRTPAEWEDWLERNHAESREVWLRLFSRSAACSELSYAHAVEVALCFGWIDSLARGYDDTSRLQRFSPRRARSGWSKSNVERVERLLEAGRMREAGLHEVRTAKADGRWPAP